MEVMWRVTYQGQYAEINIREPEHFYIVSYSTHPMKYVSLSCIDLHLHFILHINLNLYCHDSTICSRLIHFLQQFLATGYIFQHFLYSNIINMQTFKRASSGFQYLYKCL